LIEESWGDDLTGKLRKIEMPARVLNINTFLGLFFHPIFIPNGGMVGKRALTFWVNIEFIAARLPTLQIFTFYSIWGGMVGKRAVSFLA